MKKAEIMAGMSFSKSYIPREFRKAELVALRERRSDWTEENVGEALGIIWKMRGIGKCEE